MVSFLSGIGLTGVRIRFVFFLVLTNELTCLQKWRIVIFLSMTFLLAGAPLIQLSLLHSVHDTATFIREFLFCSSTLLYGVSYSANRTRSSISHLLRYWPPLLCQPLSGMFVPRWFATPGVAKRWVARTVAHIHCPGNIFAPRRHPCFKGWCPGHQRRCLSPSRRLGRRLFI